MFIDNLKHNAVSGPDDGRQGERAGGSDGELMGRVAVSGGVKRDDGRDAEEDRRAAQVAVSRQRGERRRGRFGEPRQERRARAEQAARQRQDRDSKGDDQ